MRSRFRFEYLYKKSPSGAFIGKGWIILYDFRSLKLQNKPLLLYIQDSYWNFVQNNPPCIFLCKRWHILYDFRILKLQNKPPRR